MFTSLFTYIIALLIYSAYDPQAGQPGQSHMYTFWAVGLGFLFFNLFARLRMKWVTRTIAASSQTVAPGVVDRAIFQETILATLFCAFYVYGAGLKEMFETLPLARAVPTVGALFFLVVFLAHLLVVWFYSWPAYRAIQPRPVPLKSYVASQVGMGLPILIPWTIANLASDLLLLAPYEPIRQFMASTQGQSTFLLFFLVLLATFGPLMVTWFWGCRPLAPGLYRERIQAMAERADVGFRNIHSWPLFSGNAVTAGVMGLMARFRFILVTPGLLRLVNLQELDAVMAHEIGHVKKGHLWYYLLFLACFAPLIWIFLELSQWLILAAYARFPTPLFTQVLGMGQFWQVLMALVVIGTFLAYFRFLFGYFVRNFERQADLYAFEMLDSPLPLVSCLQKIAWFSGRDPKEPNWHHFSIAQRVEYIQRAWQDPRWISRHHRKVRLSLVAFALAMAVFFSLGYFLIHGQKGQAITENLQEKALFAELGRSTNDPAAWTYLGNLFLDEKRYGQAIKAYEAALQLNPENWEAANNLAWVLATCPETRFRNPQKALHWARVAVNAAPALVPEYLDTLAESYFVNKRFQEAVETERLAISLDPNRLSHYHKQLEKFTRAAAARAP